MADGEVRYIRWFEDLGIGDVALVGGKNASLGEMYRELTPQGIRVPNGFAITAEAYRHVLDEADAWPGLHAALDGLDVDDVDDLARRAQRAREIIHAAPLPDDLVAEILAAHARLRDEYGEALTVAVRSSATAEDLPTASFAGQHESFLNVGGDAKLLDAVRLCFASLFKDRAIAYRVENGFDHFKVFLSVGVMKMVRSDCAASGVAFSLDTETGFRDVVFVTGAYGLGETVVQGTVDPDEFYVFKPALRQGRRAVLRRKLGGKDIRMVYAKAAGREPTRTMPTPAEDRQRLCISDEEVLALADATMRIEDHYSRRADRPTPMDVEWAKDGLDGQLYVVQARPETVASQRTEGLIEEFKLGAKGEVLSTGRAVGTRVASGKARVITDVSQLGQFRPGEVLVADTTAPDWGTVMKSAAAVVTNRGGRTCHAAIVARELGIPAVVGCDSATTSIRSGDEVTVSCAEGNEGRVYAGIVPVTVTQTDVSTLERPATQVMVNLGNPDMAFQVSFLPNDGVGLARMEFIIAEHIKVHPMAIVHPEKIDDPKVRKQIAQLTVGYADPVDYFVKQLSEGVGTIAAAFYPKPVIVRLSDFKSNEYASLLGGQWFEPAEANPMIGFRGASRYTHPAYAEGFALECAAMRRVRDRHGPGQREADGALLPPGRGGRAGPAGDGRPWAGAGRSGARDLRDVRDPEQRHPDRSIRAALRRVLDRLQRPDAADPGCRSRLRGRGLRLRRARPGRQGADPPDRRGRAPQPAPFGHLRPGAFGLSGDRRVPGRNRHRRDERHARHAAAGHAQRARRRSAPGSPAAGVRCHTLKEKLHDTHPNGHGDRHRRRRRHTRHGLPASLRPGRRIGPGALWLGHGAGHDGRLRPRHDGRARPRRPVGARAAGPQRRPARPDRAHTG